MASLHKTGALVISLDFELHWGVRDFQPLDRGEQQRLLAARTAIPQILRAFREHDVRATWATVGLLFARSREEAEECRPRCLPKYAQVELDPYREVLGRDESEDPFHFALSLIRQIAEQPGQEIGSHSYSHFYPLEAGQGTAEFAADLASAKLIASRSGYYPRSYVFSRNQLCASYLPVLAREGFTCYRSNEPVTVKAPVTFREQRRPAKRALRLIDSYWNLYGTQTVDWPVANNPVAVGASRYLRPYSSVLRFLEEQRLRRIADAMSDAAVLGKIFHLWWHPEDFAGDPSRNIDFLHRVLSIFDSHRRRHSMASLSMGDVSDAVITPGSQAETEIPVVMESPA